MSARRRPVRLLLALVAALAASGARADEPAAPRVDVPTLIGAHVALDGNLDEEAWKHAAVIDGLTQHEPDPGAPTRFPTRILLFTDGNSLFLGYDCFDPEPDRISVHSLQRDGDVFGDDSVDFVLDTFGDRTTAYYFLVTAGGARLDGLVSGSGGPSVDWDGLWRAATRRTATGWSAEVEIPARSLHFPREPRAWGFNIARQIARENMILRWTAIPHDAGFFDLRRAGELTGLGGMQQGIGLAVAPYAVADHRHEEPAPSHSVGRSGFDLMYSPMPALTGVLTYRTDFAETEVDARQVNLTRFPLFFPEKRAFFLEGSNLFQFGYGLESDFIPFFTRRIGLYRGVQVPIDGGVKLLGHSGSWSFGALGVRTLEDTATPPATGLGAGRLTYDAGPWRLGTILTSGDPDGVHQSSLGGIDALYRTSTFRGDKNLVASLWTARSNGDLPAGASEHGAQRHGWGARVEYPNDRWQLYGDVREFGDALDPALGFLPRPGTRWYQLGTAFQPRPDPGGPLGWARQLFFENFDYLITDLDDRAQSWRIFLAPFNVETRQGDHFEANVVPYYERLDQPFALAGGVVVPAGAYRFDRFRVQAQSSPSRSLRPSVTVWFGDFYDGRLTQWIPALGWSSPRGHVRLEANAEVDEGRLAGGDFVERLYGLRAVLAVSPDLVLSSFTQYDSESNQVGTNNLLRWTVGPGRDVYLVVNRGWDRRIDHSLVPIQDQVSLKVRWTLWW